MNDNAINTMKVKEMNKHKVYRYIYDTKVTSKQNMIKNLEMGLSTVSQNIKILEDDGLICRNGYFESTGGRKADALEINRTVRLSVGGAILKECVHWVIADLYGEPFYTEIVPLPFENSDVYIEEFGNSFRKFIENSEVEQSKVLGVSIATQGLLDKDGLSITYGKILNNNAMNYSVLLEKIPFECRFIHDSKAAAQLELWRNKNVQHGVVLMLNKNFGGAMVAEGKVQEGLHGRSGTVEHLMMNQDGPLCYCGKRGCLETYCSIEHLEQRAGIDVEAFLKLKESSQIYRSIWEDYLNYLAMAIRNLSVILDGTFMLSGYLAPHLSEEDMEFLYTKINNLATFPIERDVLILGTHGVYTQALGASLCYIERFLARLP